MWRWFPFFFLHFLLSLGVIDLSWNPNSMSRALTVLAVGDRGTLELGPQNRLTIDKATVGDGVYSEKAPLPALVTAPFYSLAKLLPGSENWDERFRLNLVLLLGALLWGAAPFAGILSVLRSQTQSRWLIPALYGSLMFAYSGVFYGHLGAAFFLLAGLLYLRKGRMISAGLTGGLAILCDYSAAAMGVGWGLFLLFNKKVRVASRLALGFIPAVLFQMFLNWKITGSPWTLPYKYASLEVNPQFHASLGFAPPQISSLVSLLVSPSRGLIWYFPVLLLGAAYGIRTLSRARGASLGGPGLWGLIAFFIFVASFNQWHGGWAWGPRYLLPMGGVILLGIVEFFDRMKISLSWPAYVTLTFSFVIQWAVRSTNLFPPGPDSGPFDRLWPDLLAGNFTPNGLLTLGLGLAPWMNFVFWGLLLSVCVLKPDTTWNRLRSLCSRT